MTTQREGSSGQSVHNIVTAVMLKKRPRLGELNSYSPVGEMAKEKLSEAQEYEVLIIMQHCTIQHSSLLCNIINCYATYTTYATIILILVVSRLCPPGQYLLADSARLDSVSGVG